MNHDEQDKSAGNNGKGDGREDSKARWPWQGQLLLAVAAMATASGLLNCLEQNSNDGELWQVV